LLASTARQARRAVARRLREAGFHAEEVKYLGGDEALERIELECEHCNLVQRVLRFIWKAFTEEGTIMEELAQEAKLDEAYQILTEYGAHRVEYWGHHGTMMHLSQV
jgi:hypothetical protein